MKISSVARLCKRTKTIILLNNNPEKPGAAQWVSNGFAMYPLYGLPVLSETHIFTIFEIQNKDKEKYKFRRDMMPAHINLAHTDETDKPLQWPRITLGVKGSNWMPLEISSGLSFIDMDYLAPYGDPTGIELHERKDAAGKPWIAVKMGMYLVGMLIPEVMLTESIAQPLRDLAKQCEERLSEHTPEARTVEGQYRLLDQDEDKEENE
jgi:hypothetical protein